jgi:hypothetical protein
MSRLAVRQSETDECRFRDLPGQAVRSGASITDVLLSLLCLVIFPVWTLLEDELRPWMISGKAAAGLFDRRSSSPSLIRTDIPQVPWKFVVLHHSGTESGSVQSIHAQHIRRRDSSGNPWKGIGYHFVIGNGSGMRDGALEATFRWKQQLQGAHAGNALYNARGIGICLIGNFENSPPTTAQLATLRSLLTQLCSRFQISPADIVGHSAVRRTACPGRLFPLQQLRGFISQSLPDSTAP